MAAHSPYAYDAKTNITNRNAVPVRFQHQSQCNCWEFLFSSCVIYSERLNSLGRSSFVSDANVFRIWITLVNVICIPFAAAWKGRGLFFTCRKNRRKLSPAVLPFARCHNEAAGAKEKTLAWTYRDITPPLSTRRLWIPMSTLLYTSLLCSNSGESRGPGTLPASAVTSVWGKGRAAAGRFHMRAHARARTQNTSRRF